MRLNNHVDWIRERALPFWLARAADDSGLFFETLDLNGTPQAHTELRLRTGMRQVYVFAHAGYLGLAERAPAIALAEAMMERLRLLAWAPDSRPGWIAKLMRDGSVTDSRRDLYDHAFVLLALAHLHQATGDLRYAGWVDETLQVIDTMLAAPHGGWAESDRHEIPRRQNPHMHLFEACLALFETTGEPRHLARAGEILELLRTRFLDEEQKVLLEFFGSAWQRSPSFRSERVDPGHMMEWTWLLRRFERSTARKVDDLCAKLFDGGLRVGLQSDGFLVDEADASGRPLVDHRRLWPQTEYLKALTVQAKATGQQSLLAKAEALLEQIHKSYLSGVPAGAWLDQFSLSGARLSTAIPASVLYHVFAPAVEIELLGNQRSKVKPT